MKKYMLFLIFLALLCAFPIQKVFGQTTTFTYQGSLNTGGSPANGSFDFVFALFDAAAGGNQLGANLAVNNVTVTNGVFNVTLNFNDEFPGADRFLEIRVRATGGGALTTLAPRQTIRSAPYSIRSQNATTAITSLDAQQFGGLLPTDFIRNSTGQQLSSNFNISGTGTAVNFDATGQFRLGGQRILDAFGTTTAVGFNTGLAGSFNTNVGNGAGQAMTNGSSNSFFGRAAGTVNTTGSSNSFFGESSGVVNSSGDSNSFFGTGSGDSNTTGSRNAFFGTTAGAGNTTGEYNSVFGTFGGGEIVSSTGNSLFGGLAEVGSGNLTNASAFGFRAQVNQSNSLILGSISGINGADNDTRVGIGTTSPTNVFSVIGNGTSSGGVGGFNEVVARFQQRLSASHLAISIDAPTTQDSIIYLARNGSPQWSIRNDADQGDTFQIRQGGSLTRFAITPSGLVYLPTLSATGSQDLCRDSNDLIGVCGSSIRLKNNINNFTPGLDLIKRLRPVTFNWKSDGKADMGLIAEEVAEIAPLLVNYSKEGVIEGVKYNRVGVVAVNAIKEQQTQIEAQQTQIESQQKQIDEQKELIKQQDERLKKQQAELDALKKLVCAQNPTAEICRLD